MAARVAREAVLDIYDVRATLEAMATRLAVPHLTDTTCEELTSLVQQMDEHMGEVARLVRLNYLFHSTLYAASGRRHLCELSRNLRFRTQHYLHAYIADLGGMPAAQQGHREILTSCRQGDSETAAQLVHDHVWEVGRSIIDFVRRPASARDL